MSRLTQASNPLMQDENYTYDLVGNRLTANSTDPWSYNANNELLSYPGTSFEYDDSGNAVTISSGGQAMEFVYDVADRIVRVEDGIGGEIAQYYYDPFGRRLWKEVDGTRTYFLYADEGLIGEYGATGNEIRAYGYVPGSTWGTQPVYLKTAGSTYFYQNDHLGTPQKLIDSTGAIVWSGLYDSFGIFQVETSQVANNLRFPGMYADNETGLYYNFHRYYDPITGRYLQADPLAEAGRATATN
ncbi:MAG: RHS domain-containing protein [Deltaproteobacteria bacterium]|nr:RHS domain-containing protein [Deltaproteobacteria bacterium]